MKTKRSTLIGLLSTLLVIATVLSSVLVFTATAGAEPESTPDRYEYPVEDLELADGYFDYWESNTYKAYDGCGMVRIELAELKAAGYDRICIEISNNFKSYFGFGFLNAEPVIGKKVSYAAGTSFVNYDNSKAKTGMVGYRFYADIPEDATLLYFWAQDSESGEAGNRVFVPQSIAFEKACDSSLQDNSLDSYTYPVEDLVPTPATIQDKNGQYKIISHAKYAAALIPIEGCVFDTVTLTPNESAGELGYIFLTETPTLEKVVSATPEFYSNGLPKMVWSTTAVTASIPDNAKYLAVYYQDGAYDGGWCPSSIVFNSSSIHPELLGAEARLNANSGLRFTTRVPTAELAGLDYTVGTLIFPTDALDGALTVETEGALNIVMANSVEGNEYTYFSASMTKIIAQNYARTFTAVSYVEVDGKYYYSSPTATSVYEAAVAAHKANPEDANADAVRAYIDGVVVIKDGKQVMPYDGYEHALTATYVVNEPTATLTITGENLTKDSLKTVILNGKIYTGGWTFDGDKFVATYSFMKDDSRSQYNYPMNTVTPAEGCITYYLKDVKGLSSSEYKADPDCHMYVVSDEYSDYRIAFINIEGTVFTGAKFTGNAASYMGWFWLEEMPTLGEAINFAGGMQGILETPRGSGSQTGTQKIEPGAKVLAVVYQRPAPDGTGVQDVLPEGILFVK